MIEHCEGCAVGSRTTLTASSKINHRAYSTSLLVMFANRTPYPLTSIVQFWLCHSSGFKSYLVRNSRPATQYVDEVTPVVLKWVHVLKFRAGDKHSDRLYHTITTLTHPFTLEHVQTTYCHVFQATNQPEESRQFFIIYWEHILSSLFLLWRTIYLRMKHYPSRSPLRVFFFQG